MRAAMQSNVAAIDSRRRTGDRYLILLSIVLLGYALAGKGFAYLGFPPLFIGEITLVLGLLAFLTTRGWSRVIKMSPALAALPLMALGIVRLIPGLQEYQLMAVRDAVIWGYALFALVVATLIIAEPDRIPMLIAFYRRFSRIFPALIPISFLLYRFGRDAMPSLPWAANAPLVHVKEGDVMVHLAGVLAFWMSDPKGKVRWIWVALLTLNVALMGVVDRAGLLAFTAVMLLCWAVKPRHVVAWRAIALIACGMIILWGTAFRLPIPGGKGREVSFDDFSRSFVSILGSDKTGGLDSTKEWRLEWWDKIIDYTIHGPYFWTGKGFGINLADDDGFQVQADKSLRSPHSIHMTYLARMGVPGLALWGLIHIVWFYCIGNAYYRARRRGQTRWAGWLQFLFAYYLAFIINGSFDVFIEGPMGGVWFWTIYGTGVGSLWVYRNRPEVLSDVPTETQADRNEDSGRAQLLPAAGWRGRSLPLGAGAP